MIHYMPFTYLSEGRISQLTQQLGPLAVQLPMDRLASEPMQAAAKAGQLQFRQTQGVEQPLLHQSVKAFISWADLHQGKIGDLAGFFRTEQWQETLRKEPGSAQLRTLIRNWSDTPKSETSIDPNFEAALFLALAHMYDQQQDDLDREMNAVQSLEKRFGQILGQDEDPVTVGSSLTYQGGDPSSDRGAYMTRQRIQSWARVALADIKHDTVFVTTSRAVWNDILDIVPEMLILDCRLDAGSTPTSDEQPDMAARLADLLITLSSAQDPRSVASGSFICGSGQETGAPRLAVLKGCTPERFLIHLINAEQDTATRLEPKGDSPNIIVGWL